MDSERRREIVKKKLTKLGVKKSGNTIHLTCKICGNTDELNVNDPSIYTEEVKKNYMCWKCKPSKAKGAVKAETKEPTEAEKIEPKKEEPVILKEEKPVFIKLDIRKDGVLRIPNRFIEKHGFIGGDNLNIELSNGKITITKQ